MSGKHSYNLLPLPKCREHPGFPVGTRFNGPAEHMPKEVDQGTLPGLFSNSAGTKKKGLESGCGGEFVPKHEGHNSLFPLHRVPSPANISQKSSPHTTCLRIAQGTYFTWGSLGLMTPPPDCLSPKCISSLDLE